MGRSISTDLRLRLVRGVERGHSRRAVAAQFEVSPATAVRVQKRYEETGSVEPARQGRPKNSGKLAPYGGFLVAAVAGQPDITMPALATRLEAVHGVKVDPSNISKFLLRLGYSYKKNPAGRRTRTHRCEGRTPGMAALSPTGDPAPAGPGRLHRRDLG